MVKSSSSLAFRSLLKSAAAKAGLHKPIDRLTGLTPAAAAYHAAVLAQDAPVLLVVPTDADVEQMTSDARMFIGALQGLAERDVITRVLPLPSQEVDPYRGLTPHLEIASARARALHAMAAGNARLVVASARALVPRLSAPDRLAAAGLVIAPGTEISPQELGDRLALAGFAPEDPVDEHGEFCVRGGVVDLYPASENDPVRLEFIGDIVESVRRYDAATQRSQAALDQIVVSPQRELLPDPAHPDDPAAFDRTATIVDYARRAGAAVIVFEIDDVEERGRTLEEQWRASAIDMTARGRIVPAYEAIASDWQTVRAWLHTARRITQLEIEDAAEPSTHVSAVPSVEYHGRIGDWAQAIRDARARDEAVVFVAATGGRAERTIELLADYEVRARPVESADDLASAAVLVTTGQLSRGFHLPSAQLLVFAETDLFEEERRVHERRKSATRTFISDFRDLKIGDLVVHVDNGIGRFVGLKRLGLAPGLDPQEFMELRYAGDDKLFVPLERLDLVQKYTGGAAPALDKLGGTTWEKAKTRVKKAMRDMAEELLKLYAARKAVVGHAFSPDSHWQEEFGDAFEYDLTADQQTAIADIRNDMESTTPMDRLLCGDVGYGKTEVAMRAAFKAVIEGKQVAFLAPTTILAFQHARTLKERFAGFPVKIDMISRFRTKQEQKDLLSQLAAGQVDIIVGTHRLLSKDVQFRDLGLLVVDEEQRFGVAHKEKIKQLRKKVDVLTMTATPIPRTLNMSLVGIRDMSVIETPPRDRLSIQTQVVKFDADVISRAIRTEIERGGQVYFVHNRVESIYSMGNLITKLVPDVKIGIGHGQMPEDELEKVMVDFVAHKFDVLLATTIVENGLDIPNANTIVINRADRYGLAQLYQLRGRVGRSDRRAYAYLLIPAEQTLSPIARRRLAAIREFSDLGSGFRIAALDLEIRGAGNLLGGQQSGHIEAVGFDMYMKLLESTIRELKGEDIEDERRAVVNLRIDLRIDESYIPDMNQRLTAYRRLASARVLSEIDQFLEECRDRYGQPPESLGHLAQFARIRLMADRLGVETLDREGEIVVLKFRQDAKIDPVLLLKLMKSRKDLTLLPPAVLKLDLDLESSPANRSSWWTARATSQVAPGFTRAEMTAEPAPDPGVAGGLFERLGGLLEQLSQALITG
ncbi:MAG TPA: transcription-repair coupling factor [Vicinamibacterales bacterium]|nr:transcription-repair coupling factor [Vicinamibacterales bacterium]